MISWLNFEELLIHNPIDFINANKSTISVAMSKKQYIDFFSNKTVYNGLYYDEEMDFCLFYYADPLQSSKKGDVYAQGYIDVEMKIYRVKWLCNVYMLKGSETTKKWNVTKTGMRVSPQSKQITMVQAGTLMKCEVSNNITGWTDDVTQDGTQDGTQGALQPDGKYKHTAWAYSEDGTDRFSTIYPRYNLLNQNGFVSGYFSSTGVLAPSTERNEQTSPFLEIDASKSYTLQVFVTLSEISRSSWSAVSWFDSNQNFIKRDAFQEADVPKPDYYTYSHTVQPPSNARFVRASFRKFDDGKLKLEQGSNATPYMPIESETTIADRPSYIGQYTDNTQEDSNNPGFYTWREIQKSATQLNYSGQEFIIDGYGMRGLHNG